eukprot:Protomagalhaensia_sp_Gyna_25__868@NODE_141_length_4923_cov_34_183251_g111_i0_p1_GENE_NODE_141_length_4923_cov_34_183251_g111_i0NODE_141_length_4923_cov_34_183251_g111_i0_p1_ORF_typecomplete_len627_score113_25DUF4363/PF14276_6/3_4e02DUF4363/PF14276_6/0_37_NODE_141_length_4923_cov_34_183251_g111_i012083088
MAETRTILLASTLLAASQDVPLGTVDPERVLRGHWPELTNKQLRTLDQYFASLFLYLSRQDVSVQQSFIDEFPETFTVLKLIFDDFKCTLPTEMSGRLLEIVLKFLTLNQSHLFRVDLMECLSCLSYHCGSEESVIMLVQFLGTQFNLKPNILEPFLQGIVAARLRLAARLLSPSRQSKAEAVPLIFNLISQDILLFDLLHHLKDSASLESVFDTDSLNTLFNGCYAIGQLNLDKPYAAIEIELRSLISGNPVYNDIQQIVVSSLLLARCFKDILGSTVSLVKWWISRCLIGVACFGTQQFDSDQLYLLTELSLRLFDLLDSTPDELLKEGFDEFVEVIQSRQQQVEHGDSGRALDDAARFAHAWNCGFPDRVEPIEVSGQATEHGPPSDFDERGDSLVSLPALLYSPEVSEQEHTYISILKALLPPSNGLGEGYLLIALRTAQAIYSDSSMNDILEQLKSEPRQCDIFMPSKLQAIKPGTSLDVAVRMLTNIRRVHESTTEKQQRTAVANYAEVNDIGKDWQTRNKIFQFVRQQQEAEELEASLPAVILEPESSPPQKSPTTTQQGKQPHHSSSTREFHTTRDPALPGARKGVANRGWSRGRRGGRGGRGHRRDPALYKANTLQD